VTILDAEELGGAMTEQLIDLFAEGSTQRGSASPRARRPMRSTHGQAQPARAGA
jgi:hypothetical protein